MSHPPSYGLRVCSNTIAHSLGRLRILPWAPQGARRRFTAIGTVASDTGPNSWWRQFTSFVLNTFMNAKEDV